MGEPYSSVKFKTFKTFTTASYTIILKISNVTNKYLIVIMRNMGGLPAIFSYVSHYISRFDVSMDKPSVS